MEALQIEHALETSGTGFIEKYRLMKDRLLNIEYEHWAAGFSHGNNHGRGHITRVLGYLDLLLGPDPLAHLDVYELFLAMMSILYHDIGLLREREGHASISKQLLEDDSNDRYIINPIDKEIIAAAVVSHSSSKDIRTECARFSKEEIIGRYRARPTVIASLVRLSDELDEDYRRADPLLQQRLQLPAESRFFWQFCQRVRGVLPVLIKKQINLNLRFEPSDLTDAGPLPNGKTRSFISFAADKLAKINHERTVLNQFLPAELQYSGLHVDVKPLPNHNTWTTPRTFVFNDSTTAEMFLGSFPELHREPANAAIRRILELMKTDLDAADSALEELESVLQDLPQAIRLKIFYEKACINSLRAANLATGALETVRQLDEGLENLVEWFRLGELGGFAEEARIPTAEIHRMLHDTDLSFVLSKREPQLHEKLPLTKEAAYQAEDSPTKRRSVGCVPIGSRIETPAGRRHVESLRINDEVYSLRAVARGIRVTNRVVAMATKRVSHFICLNNRWNVTSEQPILTKNGWKKAGAVKHGEEIMDGDGSFVSIFALDTVPVYMEVYDLTIDGEEHNYIANGLLCHNKKGKR